MGQLSGTARMKWGAQFGRSVLACAVCAFLSLAPQQLVAATNINSKGSTKAYTSAAKSATSARRHNWELSAADAALARKARDAATKKKWDEAIYYAGKMSNKLPLKVFRWMKYKAGADNADYNEISSFISQNPNWPEQDTLKLMAEFDLSEELSPAVIMKWFDARRLQDGSLEYREPLTFRGRRLFAEAWIASRPHAGDEEEINRLIRQSWWGGDYNAKEEWRFLSKHSARLRMQDYIQRIDRLIWDDRLNDASRIMNVVDRDHEQLFAARIRLRKDLIDPVRAYSGVSRKLRDNEGLLYDRIRWYMRHDKDESAHSLIRMIPDKSLYSEYWWKIRASVIRTMVINRNYKEAYRLASTHGLKPPMDISEQSWMAGWLALRYLHDPKTAYGHFYTMYSNTRTPISLGRAAYWLGRAAEANRNFEIARRWFRIATKYPTTYYGQLATQRLGLKTLTLPQQVTPTQKDGEYLYDNELAQAAYFLHHINMHITARSFLRAAVRVAQSPGEALLITRLGSKLDRPDYAIESSKEATLSGYIFTETQYPRLSVARRVTKPEPSFVHAIIRQESLFDTQARSSAGAMGLMQLMPGTASDMARKLKVSYEPRRLTSDPSYNVLLGSTYLGGMIDYYDGSYILATAAYNGGPGNVNKWVKTYGDPRKMKSSDDVVDWIESIPFSETRNYVQRVMENLQLYRYVLDIYREPVVLIEKDLTR